MLGRIRFYDYRCFYREAPATLEIGAGFTSFIGANNAGKSSLLKALYELRSAFHNLHQTRSSPSSLLNDLAWSITPPLNEHAEIISERSDPFCAVEIEPYVPCDDQRPKSVVKARMEFAPYSASFKCKVFVGDGRQIGVSETKTAAADNSFEELIVVSGEKFSFTAFYAFTEILIKCQYFGPYRNAINEGGGSHFDTRIGTGFINQWHQWKTGAMRAQIVPLSV